MNNRRSLHLLAEAYKQVVEDTLNRWTTTEPAPGRNYADDDLSPRARAERQTFMRPTYKGNSWPHGTQEYHKIDKDAIYARYMEYYKEQKPLLPNRNYLVANYANNSAPSTWEEIDSGELKRNDRKITWDFMDKFLERDYPHVHPANKAYTDKLKAAKKYPYND